MSTCQSVINVALEKLGIIGAGATPETADNTRALASLKGYYQKLINSGTFGALTDIIPATTDYDAGENERIVHDGSVTVNLPTEIPNYYETSDYGMIAVSFDVGMVRPPRDLAVICVVDTSADPVVPEDYLYDNRVRDWVDINALAAGDYAPLSHRDEDGLACALATRLASHFGQQVAQEVSVAAARFEEALTHNWSQAGEYRNNVDYF